MVGDRFFAQEEIAILQENWRVILVTLLAENPVFMGLLSLQRLDIWRTEQEYFKRIQQPSTERYDLLAKELAEAKKSETMYLDLIYRALAELNARTNRVEKAIEDSLANARETRSIRADLDSLKAAVDRMSAAKP